MSLVPTRDYRNYIYTPKISAYPPQTHYVTDQYANLKLTLFCLNLPLSTNMHYATPKRST